MKSLLEKPSYQELKARMTVIRPQDSVVGVMPVSYTHLDVYKRQVMAGEWTTEYFRFWRCKETLLEFGYREIDEETGNQMCIRDRFRSCCHT